MDDNNEAICAMNNRIRKGVALSAVLVFAFVLTGQLPGQEATSLVTGPGLEVGGFSEGEMLLGELNCVGCHRASDQVKDGLFVKQPPLLGDAGDRITPNYLRAFLDDP